MRRYRLVVLGVVVGITPLVAGCGQKGPLFLSDNPPPGYKPPRAETYKPVPYPRSVDGEATAR